MFSTIVVGTDGSPDSHQALEVAVDMAKAFPDAAINVVTAFRPLSSGELQAISRDLPEEFRPLIHGDMVSESRIQDARNILGNAGVDASYHQMTGSPTDVLLDMVDKTEADLLIVGSRGEGAAKRLLHGSVSSSVLHHAPCSVLVVKSPH